MPVPVVRTSYPLLLAGFIAAFYAFWFLIWREHGALFFQLAAIWGASPMRWLFVDMMGALSWNDCQALGYDVFVSNPCAVVPTPMNYSPLLLDLPLEKIGVANAISAGFVQNAIFLLTLPFMLRPRTGAECAIAMLAAGSSSVVFALERANLDLLEFILIAVMGFLPMTSPAARALSTAIGFFAGLVKFYPFVLGLTVLRENPRRALLMAGLFLGGLAVFVLVYAAPLRRALGNAVDFNAYGASFGAFVAAYDVTYYLGLPPVTATLLLALLLAGWLALSFRVSQRICAVVDFSVWQRPPYRHLLNGSLIVCGCFLLQQSYYYRAIFLLMLLPGLFALMRSHAALARLMSLSIAACLLCLWEESMRNAVSNLVIVLRAQGTIVATGLSLAHFAFRELVWWFLATIMAGLILSFARQSPLGIYLLSVKDRLREKTA